MKPINTVLGFAAGCVTAIVVSRLAVDVRAQDSTGSSIHVCVAADNVLKLAAPAAACAAGENSLYFTKADASAKPKDATESKDAAADRDRLAELERRLKELEQDAVGGKLANRVVAPFEVADRTGKTIFVVDAEAPQVRVYNAGGKAVARILVNENGGYFVGESATSELQATIGATGGRAGVLVLEGGATRLDLGRDEQAGTYRLKIHGQKGAVVAAIGRTKASPVAGRSSSPTTRATRESR